ncbi:jg13468 [Pararge aegeria aegeria]|uniref:Jg13468 protein n=1 Tax=Pararge aegeria aegeria TaxID=348720 RepID=A0A8S4SI90_9NEOP|nr:jg13468 [Pararge aegeria aegeria]
MLPRLGHMTRTRKDTRFHVEPSYGAFYETWARFEDCRLHRYSSSRERAVGDGPGLRFTLGSVGLNTPLKIHKLHTRYKFDYVLVWC